MSNLSGEDICNVLNYFKNNSYKANTNDQIVHEALANCIELIKYDYQYCLINNSQGELSAHYPPQLLILENELQNTNANCRTHTETIYENNIYDKRLLREHISKARTARCRTRFVIPVILFRGKHICRSSTVAGHPEIYTRNSFEYFAGTSNPNDDDDIVINEECETSNLSDLPWIDKIYQCDVDLLKQFSVSTIIDLMVETRKVKYSLYITSSEKVQSHYSDFTLMSLPYPGCEFFAEYRNQDYTAESCKFNWEQSYVNATLNIPNETLQPLKIDPQKYKEWNLVQLTQNYMKVLLRLINDGGVLIHCISGWDRTPLFISMLRVSLWADGAIHTSLNPTQILYLTLTYDWLLFGHDLANRLAKGEEILFFCFQMLKYLQDDEFSIHTLSSKKLKHLSPQNNLHNESEQAEDTNGSNISLNSISSLNSNRDSDHQQTDELSNNGNSPPLQRNNQRHTSPIAVPNRNRRQRTDSTSSLTCGSWQMVSGCGSLEKRQHELMASNRNEPETAKTVRQARLEEVRKMFGKYYGGTIGLQMKVGESPLTQTLSTVYTALGQLSAVALAATATANTKQIDDK